MAAARRFPIEQGDKVRPIDDFSELQVNMAFGSRRKVKMKNLVSVMALPELGSKSLRRTHRIHKAVSDARIVYMEDDEGGVWYGGLHAEWKVQEWRDLLGKVADLKSAYKQMPSSPRSASVSVIAVRLAKAMWHTSGHCL